MCKVEANKKYAYVCKIDIKNAYASI